MKTARLGTMVLTGVLLLSVALPAEAATTTISIVSRTAGFSPATISRPQGTTFAWKNNDASFTHTATQDAPLSLWNTGNISPGSTKSDPTTPSVNFAGVYPYHCAIHPTMTGTVKIPIKVSATSGTTTTMFTITMATTSATSPFVYDVQRRIGTGAWKAFATGVTTKSVTFGPAAAGTYSFRSRLRDGTTAGKLSGWSPKKSITVS